MCVYNGLIATSSCLHATTYPESSQYKVSSRNPLVLITMATGAESGVHLYSILFDTFLYFSHSIVSCSFHFFHYRKDLVNKEIEESLSCMQRVIDLARYIRESKVLPVKVNTYMYIKLDHKDYNVVVCTYV